MVADVPITARYRFIKNASWELLETITNTYIAMANEYKWTKWKKVIRFCTVHNQVEALMEIYLVRVLQQSFIWNTEDT